MNPKEFIEDLKNRRSNYGNAELAEMAASMLDTISKDIYSESERFIFELIQNADDSSGETNNEAHFHFSKNCLIVSHNGQPFTESDIEAITNAGASTKKADQKKTGYKGIGFKSVFGRSSRVSIFSKEYQFRFDKAFHNQKIPWQTIPLWTEREDLPSEAQDILKQSEFNVSTILELKETDSLHSNLISLLDRGLILLFLRRITKITVTRHNKQTFSIERKTAKETDAFSQVQLQTSAGQKTTWITNLFDNIEVPSDTLADLQEDDNTPDKLKAVTHTQISFAAQLEDDHIKALDKTNSLIYTYLPTKVAEFEFPFLVNGSFLTNASREGLHADTIWNQWLFKQIAEKVFDWLALLADTKYKFQVMHLLPSKFNNSSNRLKAAFDERFDQKSSQAPFIPTIEGMSRKASEVILDKTDLSRQSFIPSLSVIEFIRQQTGKLFTEQNFVHPHLEQSRKLKAIGVELFDLSDLSVFFQSSAFLDKHEVSRNFELIKYLKDKSDADKEGLWFQKLKALKFIYDTKGDLYPPTNGICFPTGPGSMELGNVSLIHDAVFSKIQQDKKVFEWLRQLGVKEPNEQSYISNVLIPGLKSGNFVTELNYLNITRYLFRLYRNKELDEEVLESLRELPLKVKSEKNEFQQAQLCFLSNEYQPQLRIENVVSAVDFVSEDYVSSGEDKLEWNIFFRAIKVKDRVEVEAINSNNDLATLRRLTDAEWVNLSRERAEKKGGFGFGDHNLIRELRIPSFLNLIATNLIYCKLFWENLLSNPRLFPELFVEASYRYGVGYGENRYIHKIENYFPWFIKNKSCIPTTTGEIRKTNEVFINNKEIRQLAGDYLPVFDYDAPLSLDWLGNLSFIPKLEIENYLFILEKISQDLTEDGTIKRANIRKIDVIYQRLTEIIVNLPSSEKKKIEDWSKDKKLLSSTQKFELANDLKWIKIEGFHIDTDKLKLISVPDKDYVQTEGFDELMKLFGIVPITMFTPQFKDLQPERTLKEKIEIILPYFIFIVERKRHEDGDKEYDRIYELLNLIDFYSASDIALSFEHLGETIKGPGLPVFSSDSNFYYKGNWRSPISLFTLVPELSKLMGISGVEQELRLLLELDEEEIKEWMINVGFDLSVIRSRKYFKYPSLTTSQANNDGFTSSQPKSSGSSVIVPEEITTTFVAETAPTSINMAGVYMTKRDYSSITSEELAPAKTYSLMSNDQDRIEVGRWSEEFAHSYFLEHSDTYTDVVWANKESESYKPYDFKLKENGKDFYIDVKGTPSSEKDVIHLSGPEWKFMLSNGDDYALVRVYNAGKGNPRLETIYNPAKLIMEGKILPTDITIQL